MVEGHADPAVHLHAVLQQARRRTRRGTPCPRSVYSPARSLSSCTWRGGSVGEAVPDLEPRLHVGEAVLELLVRRERPSERVAVERPVHRDLERLVHRADHLVQLDHVGELQLPIDVADCGRRVADQRVARHLHVLEPDLGVTPRKVEPLRRDHSDTCSRRGHEQLHDAVLGIRHHEQVIRLRTGLDRSLPAVEREAAVARGRGDRHLAQPVVWRRFGPAPRGDALAAQQSREELCLLLRRTAAPRSRWRRCWLPATDPAPRTGRTGERRARGRLRRGR